MKLVNIILGDATGGRWQVIQDYSKVLRDCGHEVMLVVNSKKAPRDASISGIEVVKIRNSGHYDPFATLMAVKILLGFRPDAVICHCGRSVALMKRATLGRVPVVAVNHSNNVKRSIPADAYFNISTHIGELIKGYPMAKGKGFHIPNMVDIPPNPHCGAREWRQPVRIGAFGRFDVVKGFHIFIEALGVLKTRGVVFEAYLGGSGPQEGLLKNLISHFGLQNDLQLVGWVEDQQTFFDQTDIFCVPALSDAFGITPLEAAVAGVPLVVSDAEGHQDMFIHGQHALIFPRGDAIALADTLEKVIKSPDMVSTMAKNAFERVVAEYSRDRFALLLEKALKDVIGV